MLKGVPQTMDITSIKAILHYLSNEILPSKFETAQQPEPNTIQIGFRGIKNINWIEVSWQGDCARILKIKRPERIGSTSTLAKQLSYGLKYMALVSIKQDKFERVIELAFAKKPGDLISKYLVFELMGKHSNIFYLDKNLKIIAVGKQIQSNQSSFRTITTGGFYSPPPPTLKKEPNEKESFENWKKNLSLLQKPLKKCLIDNYQGVSPILIKQFEYLAKLSRDNVIETNIELIDDITLKKIYMVWISWVDRFKKNRFNFSTFDEYFYSVWFLDSETNKQENLELCSDISDYYDHFLTLKKIEQIISKIDSIIYKQTIIEQRNLDMQSKLLENSENFEEYKLKADDIFLKIDLKKKDIIEAEKLYKKSKKLKRARHLIENRLNLYRENLNRLDEYSFMIENLNKIKIGTLKNKLELLEEIKEELCNEFDIYIKKLRKAKNKNKDLDSIPIKINSPNGLIIQIGRNMRQNDLISFKLSKKNDLWFHAQECPGSHVVLKTSTKNPEDNDIQIAADIAAFFCRAKGNNKVPINLVKIKDLQKIKKASLGCVTFKNSRIIWGNPSIGKNYIKKNPQ